MIFMQMGQNDGVDVRHAVAEPSHVCCKLLRSRQAVLIRIRDQTPGPMLIILSVRMRHVPSDTSIDQDEARPWMVDQEGIDGDDDLVAFVGHNSPRAAPSDPFLPHPAVELTVRYFSITNVQWIDLHGSFFC